MKKNKKSVQKLSLNKSVISKLEEGQVNGGTIITLACPQTLLCPRTVLNCPQTLLCPQTALCPQTLDCPLTLDCPSLVDGCGSQFIC
ncbi:class I lanthipeptide [Kordia zhangzhouensis]|uniref:class I lanthipeptide n=1 Tax=Kordia zhangzhouensis TaxID=1620405 RepID=UPI0012E07E43|nr:class I lanthipeptide [Kordia zhangzhouensis]